MTVLTSYELEGDAIGSCGCSGAVSCLCWGKESSSKGCDSFVAYRINQGVIAGVDVSSLAIARVLRESDQTALLYVDGHGTELQQQVLIRAFSGELGGILGTLHAAIPNHEVPRIAPITYRVEKQRVSLWIGNILVRQGMKQTPFRYLMVQTQNPSESAISESAISESAVSESAVNELV